MTGANGGILWTERGLFIVVSLDRGERQKRRIGKTVCLNTIYFLNRNKKHLTSSIAS